MNRPPLAGLRHVALFSYHYDETLKFYTEIVGMEIEWQPDDGNTYLTGGVDNLALHRVPEPVSQSNPRLDHIGFIIDRMEDVDAWYTYLAEHKVKLRTEPRTHRDGARSFYCEDPDGAVVQFICHPPLSKG